MESIERIQNAGYLSEKLLQRKCNELQARIRSTRRSDSKRQLLEVEFCYLYRELEFRRKRKAAHQNFLAKKYDKRFDNRAKRPQKVV